MDRPPNEIREPLKNSISCGVKRSILGVIPVRVASHAKRGGMGVAAVDFPRQWRQNAVASLRIDPTRLAKPFLLKKHRQQDIPFIQFV